MEIAENISIRINIPRIIRNFFLTLDVINTVIVKYNVSNFKHYQERNNLSLNNF